MPCRLAQCTDLLQTHVLVKLKLRDAQALAQTCRALRQMVTAADQELQALALVCLSSPPDTFNSAVREAYDVQELMPRQHLASQAALDASPAQQLDSLAALHARVRAGTPTVLDQLHFPKTELHEPNSEIVSWSQSPAGDCAIVVWGQPVHTDIDDGNTETTPETVGALVVGCSTDGVAWSAAMPATVELSQCVAGFSPAGHYCATVSSTGTYSAEDSMYLPCFDDVSPDLLIRVFDVRQRCWLAARPASGSLNDSDDIVISGESSSAVAVAHILPDDGEGEALLVFGVLQLYSRVIQTGGVAHFQYLPGPTALVVEWPVPSNSEEWRLVRLDLSPQPDLSDERKGAVSLGASDDILGIPCMAVAWHQSAIWAGLTVKEQGGSTLCVYDSNLACRGSWRLQEDSEPKHVDLHAEQQLLAVQHFRVATSVYRLRQYALGPLLFTLADFITRPSISPDGCFMLGLVDASVVLVDVHTGGCLASLQPSTLCTGICQPPLANPYIDVAWNSCNPSQLLVAFRVNNGVLFSVLQC